MKIVSAAEMAEIDRISIEQYGYPGLVLMENAGIRIFERYLESYPDRNLGLVFLAGGGNNGGDALVMARQAHIAGFRDITILLTSGSLGEAAGIHKKICEGLALPLLHWNAGGTEKEEALRKLKSADVIFDGMIGTGLNGALRGTAAEVAEVVRACGGLKLAIDAPSGIGDAFEPGFPCVEADITCTVGLPKLSLYRPAARPHCGRIEVVDIGFPGVLTTADHLQGEFLKLSDLSAILPPVRPDAHKYTRGTVCVLAGSPGTAGAAFLTAETASRTRAGMVTLLLQKDLYAAAGGGFRSVIGRPWDPASSPDPTELSRYSALCVGPGWGFDRREPWLEACVAAGVPGVLDADGLTLLSRLGRRIDFGGRWVLTPHPGEFSRLTGKEKKEVLGDVPGAVLEAAEAFNAVVVLKGHVTWIGDPSGRFVVIDGMNPSLGTAGSGDVLSGLLAGLLAEGLGPLSAASAAVLVHVESGRRCFSDAGWFPAEDLLPYISCILAEYGNGAYVRE